MNQFFIGDDSAWDHIASPQEPEFAYSVIRSVKRFFDSLFWSECQQRNPWNDFLINETYRYL